LDSDLTKTNHPTPFSATNPDDAVAVVEKAHLASTHLLAQWIALRDAFNRGEDRHQQHHAGRQS